MSIVLSILQILGIILLAILGILILTIIFVLFVPFCYQLEGDYHETQWAKIRVSWLLHLIRGRISYEDDLVYGEFWLFWKKYIFSYEIGSQEDNEEENEEDKVKKKSKKTDRGNVVDKIKNAIDGFKNIYPQIKKIIKDDGNKQAVKHLKDELFYLVKIILPQKSRLNAAFSTGSPDTTGQLCGFIACFPLMYQKGWALRPDFASEEAYFIGDFWGKGKIYAFQLVAILLRIVFDKNCRRMYTMIDRLLKRMKKRKVQEGK